MNSIERKLYNLVNRINEDAFTGLKGDPEIKYTDKDGQQRTIKASSAARYPEDHPAYQAYMVKFADEKGAENKPKPDSSSKKGSESEPQSNKPATSKKGAEAEPQSNKPKIDFKSSAEKRDGGEDPISNKAKMASDTKLKSLMPGMDTSAKPLSAVSPIERQKISMKTDELARLGAEAKAKGEKAPNYNLCQVTIPGTNLYCEGNKGIPRDQMPQFKGTPEPGSPADKLPRDKAGEVDTEGFFREMLDKEGINVSEPTPVPPDRLKATQSELVGVKVAGMAQVIEDPNHPAYEAITAPIYVSNDGYVVDGHHRWAAIVAHNAKHPDKPLPMNVRVIDEKIDTLIPRSNKFAEDMGIRPKAADTGAAGGPQPIAR